MKTIILILLLSFSSLAIDCVGEDTFIRSVWFEGACYDMFIATDKIVSGDGLSCIEDHYTKLYITEDYYCGDNLWHHQM